MLCVLILFSQVSQLTIRSHVLPALRAILTNQKIVKVGCEICKLMLGIASTLDLPDIEKIAKSHNPLFLDIGRQAKLKGAVESPMAPLTTLAGVCLERYAIFDSIKDNSLSNPASLSELSLLAGEVDCIWQIFRTLTVRDSVGLPLQLEQAQTPDQFVTFVIGSKPVAEGTIVGHKGFINAVMNPNNHTMRINVTHSRSVIRLTHVLVPGQTHRLHR